MNADAGAVGTAVEGIAAVVGIVDASWPAFRTELSGNSAAGGAVKFDAYARAVCSWITARFGGVGNAGLARRALRETPTATSLGFIGQGQRQQGQEKQLEGLHRWSMGGSRDWIQGWKGGFKGGREMLVSMWVWPVVRMRLWDV